MAMTPFQKRLKAKNLYRIKATNKRLDYIANSLNLTGDQRNTLESVLTRGNSKSRKDVLKRVRDFEKLVKKADIKSITRKLKFGISQDIKNEFGTSKLSLNTILDFKLRGSFYVNNKGDIIIANNKERVYTQEEVKKAKGRLRANWEKVNSEKLDKLIRDMGGI